MWFFVVVKVGNWFCDYCFRYGSCSVCRDVKVGDYQREWFGVQYFIGFYECVMVYFLVQYYGYSIGNNIIFIVLNLFNFDILDFFYFFIKFGLCYFIEFFG